MIIKFLIAAIIMAAAAVLWCCVRINYNEGGGIDGLENRGN